MEGMGVGSTTSRVIDFCASGLRRCAVLDGMEGECTFRKAGRVTVNHHHCTVVGCPRTFDRSEHQLAHIQKHAKGTYFY